jgi:SAM-dependent methyltransferase
VTGVDVDPTCVEACRSVAARLSHQNVDFEVADVTRLPYRERFELATCVELLEHLPNDGAALRSLYRALKPGGCLLVHVPMRHQQQRRILPTHARHAVPGHVRDEYVEAEIVDRVEGAGFEVGAVTTTFGPVGELAFELNTLSLGGRLRAPLAALTYPLALLLGYLEVSAGPGAGGNSFLIVARKPGPPSVMRSA